MRINNANELPECCKKLNPQLFTVAGLGSSKRKQSAQSALDKDIPRKQSLRSRVQICVTFVAFRRKLLDCDNNVAAFKHARDTIARYLGVDDADPRIRWQYGQAGTTGQQGTLVKVEII